MQHHGAPNYPRPTPLYPRTTPPDLFSSQHLIAFIIICNPLLSHHFPYPPFDCFLNSEPNPTPVQLVIDPTPSIHPLTTSTSPHFSKHIDILIWSKYYQNTFPHFHNPPFTTLYSISNLQTPSSLPTPPPSHPFTAPIFFTLTSLHSPLSPMF